MWQTNGDTDTLAAGGGVLYAGGRFTRVRPPGAAAGTSETTRTYLAAFNTSTGALITGVQRHPQRPRPRRSALARRHAPLHRRRLHHRQRRRDAPASRPSTRPRAPCSPAFTANANGVVTTIAAGSNAVFVGGDFTTINGATAMRVASVNPTTGARNAGFTGSLDARPRASAISPDGASYVVGGDVPGRERRHPAGRRVARPDHRRHASVGRDRHGAAGARRRRMRLRGLRHRHRTAPAPTSSPRVSSPAASRASTPPNLSDGSVVWDAQCLGASQATAVIGNIALPRLAHARLRPHARRLRRPARLGRLHLVPALRRTPSPTARSCTGRPTPTAPAPTTSVRTRWPPTARSSSSPATSRSVGGAAQQGLTRFGPAGGNSTPSTPLAPTSPRARPAP